MAYTKSAQLGQIYETQNFVGLCESNIDVFGDNHAVGTTKEDIWRSGGLYNWIGTATQLKVSSSSAQDAAAGTGAWSLTIEGLDSNWAPLTETVTLTGQTQVTTSGAFKRVNRIYMSGGSTKVGSGGVNAGAVYAYTGTATAGTPNDLTKVYAKIEASEGSSTRAIYSVPAGYEAGVSAIQLTSAKGDDASVSIYVRTNEGPWTILRHYELFRSGIHDSNGSVIVLDAKTDIKVSAYAATSSVSVGATIFLHLRATP